MAPGMARTQTLPPPKGVCFAFWRSGSCDRGKACDFPHIQPAPDGVSAPWGVCFDFWNRGACAKDERTALTGNERTALTGNERTAWDE